MCTLAWLVPVTLFLVACVWGIHLRHFHQRTTAHYVKMKAEARRTHENCRLLVRDHMSEGMKDLCDVAERTRGIDEQRLIWESTFNHSIADLHWSSWLPSLHPCGARLATMTEGMSAMHHQDVILCRDRLNLWISGFVPWGGWLAALSIGVAGLAILYVIGPYCTVRVLRAKWKLEKHAKVAAAATDAELLLETKRLLSAHTARFPTHGGKTL